MNKINHVIFMIGNELTLYTKTQSKKTNRMKLKSSVLNIRLVLVNNTETTQAKHTPNQRELLSEGVLWPRSMVAAAS